MQIKDKKYRILDFSSLPPDRRVPEMFWLLSAGFWKTHSSDAYYTTNRLESTGRKQNIRTQELKNPGTQEWEKSKSETNSKADNFRNTKQEWGFFHGKHEKSRTFFMPHFFTLKHRKSRKIFYR